MDYIIHHGFKIATVEILANKLGKILMVKVCVLLIFKNPSNHGSVLDASARNRRVNGIVYEGGCIACRLESPEGKVVIPWYHLHLTVLFIEIIVVNQRAGIAVKIQHKVMNRKVAYDGIDVKGVFRFLSELMRRDLSASVISVLALSKMLE